MGACFSRVGGVDDSVLLLPDAIVLPQEENTQTTPPPNQTVVQSQPLPSPPHRSKLQLDLKLPPQSHESPQQPEEAPASARKPGFSLAIPQNKPEAEPANPSTAALPLRLPIRIPVSTPEESEESRSQAKLDLYGPQLSELAPFLYLGADSIARNEDALRQAGISYVLNSAGMVCENYLSDRGDFKYMTLYLLDGNQEDIECVIYDVIDWLDEATGAAGSKPGSKVLVHCWQGVSRSTALCVMYLMLRWNMDYDTAYQHVRDRRPIARPNLAFMCQLLAWHKRMVSGVDKPRLYEIKPQSDYVPKYLVAKAIQTAPRSTSLHSATSFVLQTPSKLYLWKGKDSPAENHQVALRHVDRLIKFEHGGELVALEEGEEPEEFWKHFADGQRSTMQSAPSTSQPRSVVSGAVSATVNAIPDVTEEDDDSVAPRMFSHPEWLEIEMFDTDDLDDANIFVIYSNPTNSEKPGFTFVWIGDSADQVEEDAAIQLGKECLESIGVSNCDDVRVVLQGNEPNAFWSLFRNG
eukprot:c5824_g1_i1.p1 GENE.c5824_g1_i1~~c5824_g1_i1.p1  ORF type:complete len:530 (+),score=88.92 c5824_g1_i1:26-1591(+)